MEKDSEKSARALGRRRFLRDSGMAAGALAGMGVSLPAVPPARDVQMDTAPSPPSSLSPVQSKLAPKRAAASIGRQLSHWVAEMRYEQLPPEVVDRVKGLTLHAISSALLGSQMEDGRKAVKLATEQESAARNAATILVSGERVTRGGAAFANAEMAQAAGKWDTFRMLTHPGISVLPSALATAENEGSSGKEFIAAVAAGYEVMERMAADFIPSVAAHGFHPNSVFGVFGAAVAAAKLMRLSEDQLLSTISHCASLAGGSVESAGRQGVPARDGIFAAAMGKLGDPAAETVLEGESGFYDAYTGNNRGDLTYSFVGDRHADLGLIAANLGNDWMLLETLYRIYSISGYNIAHIDVTAQLCEEHDIRYEDVDRIEAVVNWLETLYPSPAFPQRHEAAKPTKRGNTPYFTAYGVVKRSYPMLPGTPDPPEVLELMNRVTIIPSHEMPLFGPRITIFTKDGRSYTKQGTGREFIWDFNEEVRRIRAVTPGLPIPAAQYKQLIETCRNLDREPRADKLVQLTLKKA